MPLHVHLFYNTFDANVAHLIAAPLKKGDAQVCGSTRVVHMWFPTYVVGNRKCLRNLILIGRLLSSNIGNSMIKILWLKLVDQSWLPTCLTSCFSWWTSNMIKLH